MSENPTKLQALALYLFWLKNGFEQNMETLFDLRDDQLAIIADERISDKNDAKEITESMKSKLKSKNYLEKFLDLRMTNSQNSFVKIEDFEIQGFPRLDLDTIRKKITFGNYQLEQAYGYLAEHFEINDHYALLISERITEEQDSQIIITKIQSRHRNSMNCKTGKRALGCCSHVAAIIYFMSLGRYDLAKIPKPGLKNVIIPITNESDDEENLDVPSLVSLPIRVSRFPRTKKIKSDASDDIYYLETRSNSNHDRVPISKSLFELTHSRIK
ncbi:unnamed protein product [Brachionus calyciflorus]|uniref:SWIM-type domain-containing protein n=1 Tax=Brachionus calyciflorus TaxID=104777 RepID=A0A813ZZ67_9BILA|nr:unnamed protein product [Brachionus calyciflorus]